MSTAPTPSVLLTPKEAADYLRTNPMFCQRGIPRCIESSPALLGCHKPAIETKPPSRLLPLSSKHPISTAKI
jgi:hypothetical protein